MNDLPRVFAGFLVASLCGAQGAFRQLVCRSSGARGGERGGRPRGGTARRVVAEERAQEGPVISATDAIEQTRLTN